MFRLRFDHVWVLRDILLPLMNLAMTASFSLDRSLEDIVIQVGDGDRVSAALRFRAIDRGYERLGPEPIHTPFGVHFPTLNLYLEQSDLDRILIVDFLVDVHRIHLSFNNPPPEDEPFVMLMCDDPVPPPRRLDDIDDYFSGFDHGITLRGSDFIDILRVLSNNIDRIVMVSITDLGVVFTTDHDLRVITRDRWVNLTRERMPFRFRMNLDDLDAYTNAYFLSNTVHISQRSNPEPHFHTMLSYSIAVPHGDLMLFCPLVPPDETELNDDNGDDEFQSKKKRKVFHVLENGDSSFKKPSTSSGTVAALKSEKGRSSDGANIDTKAECTRRFSDLPASDRAPALRDQFFDEIGGPDSHGYKISNASSMSLEDGIVKLKATQDKMMEDINVLLNQLLL